MTDREAIEYGYRQLDDCLISITMTNDYAKICILEERKNFLLNALVALQEREERSKGNWVQFPCKVGQKVYAVWDYDSEHVVDDGTVFAVGVDERETMWISVRYESGLRFYHPSKDFGEIVFLTREEAEAALKGAEHEGRF